MRSLSEHLTNDHWRSREVRAALHAIEFDLHCLVLGLVSQWPSDIELLPESRFTLGGLQRPAMGPLNGVLRSFVRERRRLQSTIDKDRGLGRVLSWMDGEISSSLQGDLEDLVRVAEVRVPLSRNRQLLELVAAMRNRIEHDAPVEEDWWQSVGDGLRGVVRHFVANDWRKIVETLPIDEPWSKEGAIFNGFDRNSTPLYRTESVIEKKPEQGKAVMSAFASLLGVDHSDGAELRELFARSLPFELKGVRLGEFVLGEPVAAGGFATVHRGFQSSTGRPVAIKLLRPGLPRGHVAAFEEEARTLARISHPHVVEVIDSGEQEWHAPRGIDLSGESWFGDLEAEGQLRRFMALEWIDGQTLDELITANSRPADDLIVSTFADCARALNTVHGRGIVHRDLKPANVMLRRDGRVVLMDFGVAAQVDGDEVDRAGTPPYMAPEQLKVRDVASGLDERVDVYGLCATFYEVFTSRRLFDHDGRAAAEIRRDKLDGRAPTMPRRHRRDISPEIETILMGGLAADPSDRYPSARALAEDLDRVRDDEPLLFKRPGPWRRFRLFRRRNPGAVLAIAVFLVSAVLLGAKYIADSREELKRFDHAYDLAEGEAKRAATEATRAGSEALNAKAEAENARVRADEAITAEEGARTERENARDRLVVLERDAMRAAFRAGRATDVLSHAEVLAANARFDGVAHHLAGLAAREMMSIRWRSDDAHDVVEKITVDPSGRQLATLGGDGGIQVRGVSDGACVVRLDSTVFKEASDIALRDPHHLLYCMNGGLYELDIATASTKLLYRVEGEPVFSCRSDSLNRVVCHDRSQRVVIIDLQEAPSVRSLEPGFTYIEDARLLDGDQKLLVEGDAKDGGRSVTLIDLLTGRELAKWSEKEAVGTRWRVLESGVGLAIWRGSEAAIHDIATGRILWRASSEMNDRILAVLTSADLARVHLVGERNIETRDRAGEIVRSVSCARGFWSSSPLMAQGESAMILEDGFLQRLDLTGSHSRWYRVAGFEEQPSAITQVPNGDGFLIALGGRIELRDIDDSPMIESVSVPIQLKQEVDLPLISYLARSGSVLQMNGGAVAVLDGPSRIVSRTGQVELEVPEGIYPSAPEAVARGADGRSIAWSAIRNVRVATQQPTGRWISQLLSVEAPRLDDPDPGTIQTVALSPDERILVATEAGLIAEFTRDDSGYDPRRTRYLPNCDNAIRPLKITSIDADRIVVAYERTTSTALLPGPIVFSLATGAVVELGPRSGVAGCAVAPDGGVILIWDDKGGAKLVRLSDGARLHHLLSVGASAIAGGFSADGRTAWVFRRSEGWHLFDVVTGDAIATIEPESELVWRPNDIEIVAPFVRIGLRIHELASGAFVDDIPFPPGTVVETRTEFDGTRLQVEMTTLDLNLTGCQVTTRQWRSASTEPVPESLAALARGRLVIPEGPWIVKSRLGKTPVVGDSFEPNDSSEFATRIDPGRHVGLTVWVHDLMNGDSDWFRIHQPAGTVARFFAKATGGEVKVSYHLDDEERTPMTIVGDDNAFHSREARDFFAVVESRNGDETSQYDIDFEIDAWTPEDRFEPNDTADAPPCLVDGRHEDLVAARGEFYLIRCSANTTTTISLEATENAQGWSMSMRHRDWRLGAGRTNRRLLGGIDVRFDALADCDVILEVSAPRNGDSGYSLSMTTTELGRADRFEPNDTAETAALLTPGRHDDLVLANQDHYRVPLSAGVYLLRFVPNARGRMTLHPDDGAINGVSNGRGPIPIRRAGQGESLYDSVQYGGEFVVRSENAFEIHLHLEGDPRLPYRIEMFSFASGQTSGLMRAARGARESELALFYVESLLLVDPKHKEARIDRIIHLIGLGRASEALAQADALLAESADNPGYHGLRARSLRALGRNAEAIAEYDIALKARPDAAIFRTGRGLSLLSENRIEEATKDAEIAFAAQPDDRDTLLLRCGLAVVRRDIEATKRMAALLQEKHADVEYGYEVVWKLLRLLGRPTEARREVESLLEREDLPMRIRWRLEGTLKGMTDSVEQEGR